MPILSPRIVRIKLSGWAINSWPLNKIELCGVCDALAGKSCMIDKALIDLPEPLSPTKASVWPLLSEKLISLTASKTPEGVLKLTERFLTLSNDSSIYPF